MGKQNAKFKENLLLGKKELHQVSVVTLSIEDVQEESQSQNIDYKWHQEEEQTNYNRQYTNEKVIPRKYEAQPYRGTRRRRDEEQIKTKKCHICNHRRTKKEELQQRNRLGTGSRKTT